MKEALDGANHLVLGSATCQTVTPSSPARSSGHFSIAPPHDSRGMPRCFWYHAARALWSFVLLKNTPPIPVTFAIAPAPLDGQPSLRRSAVYTLLTIHHRPRIRSKDT